MLNHSFGRIIDADVGEQHYSLAVFARWVADWVRRHPAEATRLGLGHIAVPEWFEGRHAAAHNDDEIFGPAPDDKVICIPLKYGS